MTKVEKIIDYIEKSTLEKDKLNRTIGLFKTSVVRKFPGLSMHFQNESYILRFSDDKYYLLNRDTRHEKNITESMFFSYLDILIKIDLLRQQSVGLREILMDDNLFKSHFREESLYNLIK